MAQAPKLELNVAVVDEDKILAAIKDAKEAGRRDTALIIVAVLACAIVTFLGHWR